MEVASSYNSMNHVLTDPSEQTVAEEEKNVERNHSHLDKSEQGGGQKKAIKEFE